MAKYYKQAVNKTSVFANSSTGDDATFEFVVKDVKKPYGVTSTNIKVEAEETSKAEDTSKAEEPTPATPEEPQVP